MNLVFRLVRRTEFHWKRGPKRTDTDWHNQNESSLGLLVSYFLDMH